MHELTSDELRQLRIRASGHAGRQRPIFGAKLEAWRQKSFMFFTFYNLSAKVFGTVDPFSWTVPCPVLKVTCRFSAFPVNFH